MLRELRLETIERREYPDIGSPATTARGAAGGVQELVFDLEMRLEELTDRVEQQPVGPISVPGVQRETIVLAHAIEPPVLLREGMHPRVCVGRRFH